MEDLNLILQDRLTSIYKDFIQNLGCRITEIREIWLDIRERRSDSAALTRLKRLAHDLASCSAPFNLFLLADKAHKLENFLAYSCAENRPLSDVHLRQIDLLIDNLETAALDTNNTVRQPKPRRWEPAAIVPDVVGDMSLVYILQTGFQWAESLFAQLQSTFQVRTFYDHESFTAAVSENYPKIIITDVELAAHQSDKNQKDNFNGRDISHIPVIFIARENDITRRLLAVRSGAACFYTLPLDAGKIIDKIQNLTTGIPKNPFRIMVIDDDIPMARFYAMVLSQEGMDVTLVNNPALTLEKIDNYRPELILMNSSLPGITAPELTRIIRQEENFAGIAVIFLSGEINYVKQLEAINSGGDDFLCLPIEPEHLVATISSRVSRARTLNTMNNNLLTALRELGNQQFALDQHAIVSITNINGTIIYVNEKLCEISGYTRSELLGKDHRILSSGMHDSEFFRNMWSTISAGKVWQSEICNRKKNGELYWMDVTIVPFIDKQQRPYQFVSINSDITAKKFTERDLLEARDIAINANQAKSEFLSKMSHELRTPLNAVLGFSQLLATSKEHVLPDTQLQYINEIHNAGNHLLNLINEVLDLSRIESDQLITESVNIPLPAFLDECIALIRPLANQKRIDISLPYRSNNEVSVYADPLRLKQVMVNLLSNAVKYNSSPGTITVRILENSDKIIIEVSDTGAGIRPDQIKTLFQPFTRLPQHKKIEGVGIGLALSKRLIELMGGRIGVRSSVGKQTTFWVEISKADRILQDVNALITGGAAIQHPVSAYEASATLLYIEDNEANLLLVRELLAAQGNISLLHSYTVRSGIELALANKPDIILMDLELPDMSGFEGINILQQEQSLQAVPVIAISAYANRENIQLARQLGFAEYISKPIDINSFLATINNLVNHKIN